MQRATCCFCLPLLTAGALSPLQQQQRTVPVTGTAAATAAEARRQVKTPGREPAAGITMIPHPNTAAARARRMLQAAAPLCQMQSQMRLLHRSISTSAAPGHATTPAAAGAAAGVSAQQWHMMTTLRRMKFRVVAGGKFPVSSVGPGQGYSWTAGKRSSCCWQQRAAKRRCR